MRKLLLTVFFLTSGLIAYASEEAVDYSWRISADVGISHSQGAYSDNWEGDEKGIWTWISNLNLLAEKKVSPLLETRSTMKLEYGQTQSQNVDSDAWSIPRKSADKIDLESLLKFDFNLYLEPFIALRFQSLFTDERVDPVDYLNPVIVTESAGISRTIFKSENRELLSRLGLALHQRVDRNAVIDSLSGDSESSTVSDAGIEWIIETRFPIYKDNLKFSSKLLVFQAFHNSEANEMENEIFKDYWKATDVELETAFIANITRLIMVNLKVYWLYDKEIDLAGRFKEAISVGLTYTLI